MKNLENLTGTKHLSKNEQLNVKGGFSGSFCGSDPECPEGQHCEGIFCVPDDPNFGGSGGGGGGDNGGLEP